MPQEFRKRGRGRRGQEKEIKEREKKENILDQLRAQTEDHARPAKRQRLSPQLDEDEVNLDQPNSPVYEDGRAYSRSYEVIDTSEPQQSQEEYPQSQFFGFLDEEEQSFLKRIDLILANNSYESPDEKPLFLGNAWVEVKGKELKIASSQSCSRVLERLIKASNKSQLKGAWSRMQGNFLTLVQHRFASHVIEALLTFSAPYVSEELLGENDPEQEDSEDYTDEETRAVKKSMEDYFLECVAELKDNLGFLMTNQFASHTLRVLLLALAGRPLAGSDATNLLQSKKKEKIGTLTEQNNAIHHKRVVPDSFQKAISGMAASALAGLDTNYIRAVATNPLANPVLQLFLELEFATEGKQKAKDQDSLYRRLLPDDPPSDGTPSASFIKGLLFDPVGSRLLETIVQCAPGKTFKVIYRSMFKENLSSVVRNEIAGFVVIKILERLGQEELQAAQLEILPQIGTLIERSRHSIIKCLIERCRIRTVDTSLLSESIAEALGGTGQELLNRLLQPSMVEKSAMDAARRAQLDQGSPTKRHASMLAQTMLAVPDPLQGLILDSLLATDSEFLALIAKDKSATHVLQAALKPESVNKNVRRSLVQKLESSLLDMAMDRVGSHVVDALIAGTVGLQFLRERIAEELLRNERQIRESDTRVIWKNWMMNLYQWKRGDWIMKMKEQTGESSRDVAPQPAQQQRHVKTRDIAFKNDSRKHEAAESKQMSGIEAARARFAQRKPKRGNKFSQPSHKLGAVNS